MFLESVTFGIIKGLERSFFLGENSSIYTFKKKTYDYPNIVPCRPVSRVCQKYHGILCYDVTTSKQATVLFEARAGGLGFKFSHVEVKRKQPMRARVRRSILSLFTRINTPSRLSILPRHPPPQRTPNTELIAQGFIWPDWLFRCFFTLSVSQSQPIENGAFLLMIGIHLIPH